MAETTTKKKTAGRPKKVEEVVNIDNKEIVDQNEIIKQLPYSLIIDLTNWQK